MPKQTSRTRKNHVPGHPSSKRASRGSRPRKSIETKGKKGGRKSPNRFSETLSLFPDAQDSRKRFGIGVVVAILERLGESTDLTVGRQSRFAAAAGRKPKTTFLKGLNPSALAQLLAGLAHADRIRIACAIMTGSHTHAALQEHLCLKTGPLYHHLRSMERSGILHVAERNQYELTEVGRAVFWVSALVGTLDASSQSVWKRKRTRAR